MFENPPIKTALPLLMLKRACFVLLAAYLSIGMIAAYRAYYQVHSLELKTAESILRRGSAVTTNVVSYARTTVDVRLELVQDARVQTLATQRIPGNEWAFFDPRSRQGSQITVLTEDVLQRFEPGLAHVRATAIGRPQWTRLPPPVVREFPVIIQRD